MCESPVFPKDDRYKRSSYLAYNWKMPISYDSCIWLKLFNIDLLDEAVIRQIPNNKNSIRILDIGCATGRLLDKLAKRGYTNLSGIDLAPRIIEIAREKLSKHNIKVELSVADTEDKLPWSDNTFNVVMLTGVIHHFYRLYDALKESYRVLDNQGILIISDPYFPAIVRQLINSWLHFFPHDGDFRFYTPCSLEMKLTKIGLKDIYYSKVGRWSYIIVGKKYYNNVGLNAI